MSIGEAEPSTYHSPLFEPMAHMNDEAIWELLTVLYGLIDAYETHYAEPLQRLRQARHRQLCEQGDGRRQMRLPIDDSQEDLF